MTKRAHTIPNLAGAAAVALTLRAWLPAATIQVPLEKPTIQAAIDAAAAGDTVLVAPGEFVITEPLTFRGKALTVRSAEGPGATSVRMAAAPKDPNAASVVLFNGGETAAARLEGFTLTGGEGMGPREASSGGGVHCFDSSPTLVNLRISGNRAMAGGGLSCQGASSSPLVIDCHLTGNRALFFGGGGVYCGGGSKPAFLRATIASNYGRHEGGGIFCQESSPSFVNCLIVENEAKDTGGGVSCHAAASPRFMNCTIEGNRVAWGAQGISSWGSSPAVTNSIVASVYADEASSVAVSYSLLPTLFPGPGNLEGDPLFPCAGDYHLRPESPAIDAGAPDGAPAADLEGRDRPCGDGIDLGAYENCRGDAALVCFVRGNVDADGSFDLNDAVIILGFLFLGGEAPECLKSADVNDDAQIDLTDGVSVLGYLFLGDPAPPDPFEACGIDVTPDSLTCRFFPACH